MSPRWPAGAPARLLLALAGAPLANLVLWLAATRLAGIELEVLQTDVPTRVAPGQIVLVSLCGVLLAALLTRFAGRGPWTVLVLGAFALSMLGPLLLAADPSATVALGAMHLVVALFAVVLLRPDFEPVED